MRNIVTRIGVSKVSDCDMARMNIRLNMGVFLVNGLRIGMAECKVFCGVLCRVRWER